jgi:hypothetical protein
MIVKAFCEYTLFLLVSSTSDKDNLIELIPDFCGFHHVQTLANWAEFTSLEASVFMLFTHVSVRQNSLA